MRFNENFLDRNLFNYKLTIYNWKYTFVPSFWSVDRSFVFFQRSKFKIELSKIFKQCANETNAHKFNK